MRIFQISMTDIKLLVLGGMVIFLDQASKYWARSYAQAQLNQGGVFGLLPGWNWSVLSILILIGLMLFVLFNHQQQLSHRIGWSIVVAAGMSNMIDRLIFGGVWDWIYYPVINVVGNIADVLLGLGVILLLLPIKIKNN